jgi:hypothetical protein
MIARFPPGPVLRVVDEVDDRWMRADHVRRVPGARIVFVDHALLRHDFPGLAAKTDEQRADWLLAHAAVISVAQTAHPAANTPIRVVGASRPGWRPARYGRAVIVAAREDGPASGAPCGMLDLKGAGVAADCVPSLGFHASGLCALSEVLREMLFQWLIDAIFARAAPSFWTLPAYGVIDLDFDVRTRSGETLAAGMVVRRAHRREASGIELPRRGSVAERIKLEIELLLRHYGVTSSNRGTRFRFERGNGRVRVRYVDGTTIDPDATQQRLIAERIGAAPLPLSCDAVNIQLTRELNAAPESRAQVVDFGHYQVRARFEDPLVSLIREDFIRWGAALWPHDAAFVQPRPALCVRGDLWGAGDDSSDDAEDVGRIGDDGPARLADTLARAFRAGTIRGDDVRDAIRGHVAQGTAGWA